MRTYRCRACANAHSNITGGEIDPRYIRGVTKEKWVETLDGPALMLYYSVQDLGTPGVEPLAMYRYGSPTISPSSPGVDPCIYTYKGMTLTRAVRPAGWCPGRIRRMVPWTKHNYSKNPLREQGEWWENKNSPIGPERTIFFVGKGKQ
jgi:hypothetical protein